MLKTMIISTAVIVTFAIGSSGIWFLVSEWQAAQERRAKFFDTAKTFPISGDQKTKPTW